MVKYKTKYITKCGKNPISKCFIDGSTSSGKRILFQQNMHWQD